LHPIICAVLGCIQRSIAKRFSFECETVISQKSNSFVDPNHSPDDVSSLVAEALIATKFFENSDIIPS
jgi:hypothetical protein